MFVMNLCVESLCTSWKLSEHMPRAGQCSLHSWQQQGLWRHHVCLLLSSNNCRSVFIFPTRNLSYKQLWFVGLSAKLKVQVQRYSISQISPKTCFYTSQWKSLYGEVDSVYLNAGRPNTKTFIHRRPMQSHNCFTLNWKLKGSVPHSSTQKSH